MTSYFGSGNVPSLEQYYQNLQYTQDANQFATENTLGLESSNNNENHPNYLSQSWFNPYLESVEKNQIKANSLGLLQYPAYATVNQAKIYSNTRAPKPAVLQPNPYSSGEIVATKIKDQPQPSNQISIQNDYSNWSYNLLNQLSRLLSYYSSLASSQNQQVALDQVPKPKIPYQYAGFPKNHPSTEPENPAAYGSYSNPPISYSNPAPNYAQHNQFWSNYGSYPNLVPMQPPAPENSYHQMFSQDLAPSQNHIFGTIGSGYPRFSEARNENEGESGDVIGNLKQKA